MRKTALLFVACLTLLVLVPSCRIEPPLYLADLANTEIRMAEVETNIEVIWDRDGSWRDEWYYGWDDEDTRLWGPLENPVPTNYEVRILWRGDMKEGPMISVSKQTIWSSMFRRRFDLGWYDMLIWSNIDSDDGVQSVVIDESNPEDVHATTNSMRRNISTVSRGPIYNNPEIFFAGLFDNLEITSDPADYDYYDEVNQVWVKHVNVTLNPLVYMYLVQVIIYNNNGLITGLADHAGITSLADGVSLHTGHTHYKDVSVGFGMRRKQDLPARGGRRADILGGKLTTFGLCDMESWARSRSSRYSGGRGDLTNSLLLNLMFSNSSDSVYAYDITDQMLRQAHGGIITIEIDADTIHVPASGTHTGTMFDPTVENYGDSVVHNFEM